MKSELTLLLTAATLLVVISACTTASSAAPGPKQVSVEVTCDEFAKAPPPVSVSRSVELGGGDSLVLTLCSNPSTGFQWESPRVADQAVLEQGEHQVEPAKTGLAGAAGAERWTFKALKKGSTTVSMDYSRPWAGGEKGVWKLSLAVVVQ